VFVAFIVWASAKTFAQGWPAPRGAVHSVHSHLSIQLLAGAEIAAALAFVWPAAQLWAGGALVAIFAIATILDLKMGGAPVRFADYSATALILMFLESRLRVPA
jgi:hypothetical protein